jgi:Zn-finger protein
VYQTALLLCTLLVAASAQAIDLPPPSTAEVCGDCHREIHVGWKRSAHAAAMESRLFQDALKMAESDFGAQARKTCLGCHAPVAVLTGDLGLVKKVSWEGITCDYCHSVREVTLTGANPRARVDFSRVKSGPSQEATSAAHGTAFSPVHTSSQACVTCHEYKNAQGLAVLTTYSEWQQSTYGKEAGGCQSCHMARVQGHAVDPRVKTASRLHLNLHEIPGSHSIEQLNKAVKAQLSSAHEGGKLRVSVQVTNRGAGHSVPTGSPLRQLILELRADAYNGKHFREERIYRRVVADASGARLDREHLAFMNGARVLSDTRLAANETRTETFAFAVPQGVQTQLDASFYYYYSPMASTEAEQKLKFLSIRRLVQ